MKSSPLFRSRKLLDIIAVAKIWNSTPADVLGIEDDYIYCRYCVNEACTYVYNMMQPDKDGNIREPIFPSDKDNKSYNPGLDLLLRL